MTNFTPLTDEQIDKAFAQVEQHLKIYQDRAKNCLERLRDQAHAYNALRAQIDKAKEGMTEEPEFIVRARKLGKGSEYDECLEFIDELRAVAVSQAVRIAELKIAVVAERERAGLWFDKYEEAERKLATVREEHRQVMQPALNYILHVGETHTMRGKPHPQQWIVDALELALKGVVKA